MGLPPEVLFILLIVVAITQVLRATLNKRAQSSTSNKKPGRAYRIEDELRKFLESVAGEEIREESPPKVPQPPPVQPPPVVVPPPIHRPARPIPPSPPRRAPQRVAQPPFARSTVQIPVIKEKAEVPWTRIGSSLSEVTEPVSMQPATERLSPLPRPQLAHLHGSTASVPTVMSLPSSERLRTFLANRSLVQHGIVLSEVLGLPKAFAAESHLHSGILLSMVSPVKLA